MPEVNKATSPARDLRNGHTFVGLSPIPLTIHTEANRGVLIRCPGPNDPTPNTGIVYIGRSAASVLAHGMPMPPGSDLVLPVSTPNEIWIAASCEGCDVAWMIL
jgi:hypothetical protein